MLSIHQVVLSTVGLPPAWRFPLLSQCALRLSADRMAHNSLLPDSWVRGSTSANPAEPGHADFVVHAVHIALT